jgi:hypothetical protein
MTPETLRLYRTRHVIRPVQAPGPYGPEITVCVVDGIRVVRRRSGALPLLWRHDPDEIKRLAAIERGESTEV